jgi:hypothetical protein
MLNTMIGQHASPSSVNNVHATAAADTAVVITLAASPGHRHLIHGMQWSYSAAPTGGRLTVADGITTIFDVDITAAADRYDKVISMLKGSINTAMTITLAAGSGTVVGKLNVQSTQYPS